METPETNLKFILARPEESEKPSGDEKKDSQSDDKKDQSSKGNNKNTDKDTSKNTGGSTNNNTNNNANNSTNTNTGTSTGGVTNTGTSGGSSYYSSGSTVYNTDDSVIAVPNTGERVSSAKVSGHSALLPISLGLFVIVAVAIIARLIVKQKKSHLKFADDASRLGFGPLQISLVGSSTFALLFLGMSLIHNASIENQKTVDATSAISISSLGSLETKITTYDRDETVIYTAKDTVKVTTPENVGFSVTIKAEDEKLYLDGDKTSKNYFSPVAMSTDDDKNIDNLKQQENTWGFSIDGSHWAPVPTTAEVFLAGSSLMPSSDRAIDSETDVYFGINPGKDLKNGTYSTKITYTLIADEPTPIPTPVDPEPTPTPSVADCSATVHPTTTDPCVMPDGNEWIYGNEGNAAAWTDLFTDGTGEDSHDATLVADFCPTGYSAPSKTVYEALVDNAGRGSQLYSLLGLSSDVGALFWSSTEHNLSDAYLLVVSDVNVATNGFNSKSYNYYLLCYKTTSSESGSNDSGSGGTGGGYTVGDSGGTTSDPTGNIEP